MPETSAENLIENQAMWPDDFHECIPRIREVAGLDLQIPADLAHRVAVKTQGLLVAPSLLDECAAALIAGSIVLQGPPGTGKSTLARALAAAFNAELLPVTAHEDWSTFEIIGRQELRVDDQGGEEIVPVNGHFTEAVIRCANCIPGYADDPAKSQASWLLIDELNRAHPDKAFGELFSVLGADEQVDITLGFQRKGNDILVLPRRFRIIATVNSIDKQFVNALSQGLRRRFTFLTYDIPPQRAPGEPWGTESSLASKEYSVVTQIAVQRVARRTTRAEAELSGYVGDPQVRAVLEELFGLVEQVRYATNASDYPFIPIGTAPLIDAIELFLIRSSQRDLPLDQAGELLDWAASVKLVPLFDSGGVSREKLANLAKSLDGTFGVLTHRAIFEIESDGLFYVTP